MKRGIYHSNKRNIRKIVIFYKKYMKKILTTIILFFVLLNTTFAYQSTNKDKIILNTVYEKVNQISEKNPEKLEILYETLSTILESLDTDNQTKYLINQLYSYVWELIWYSQDEKYEVLKIIDWDTIKILYDWEETNIRMIWIDAPESSKTRFWYIEEYWSEATEKITEIIWDNKVSVELDESQWKYDKYNRLLAYVIVDWENVNLEMIEAWFAKEYTYNSDYKYKIAFENAEEKAKEENLGMWTYYKEASEENDYKFFTSSHWSSKYYYCETDDSWEELSSNYLKEYISENDLLKDENNEWKTLHEECE